MSAKENRMKNYIFDLYTVPEFKRDNPTLAEKAEQALQYLKGYCPKSEGATFVVIKVEGYNCIAYLTDEFSPYTLGEMIAPFDENRIYPLHGLITQYAFKRY